MINTATTTHGIAKMIARRARLEDEEYRLYGRDRELIEQLGELLRTPARTAKEANAQQVRFERLAEARDRIFREFLDSGPRLTELNAVLKGLGIES